jgi:hypothetical protein
MTKQEAKDLSLKVWEYLAAHPEIRSTQYLPSELSEIADDYTNKFPLCLYTLEHEALCCECALGGCGGYDSFYGKWFSARTIESRQAAAQTITDKIKAWKVE